MTWLRGLWLLVIATLLRIRFWFFISFYNLSFVLVMMVSHIFDISRVMVYVSILPFLVISYWPWSLSFSSYIVCVILL
jgi:hypothetical protein